MNTIHIANNHNKKLPTDNKDAIRQVVEKAFQRLQQSFIQHTMQGSNPSTAQPSKLSDYQDQRIPPFPNLSSG